MDPATIAMLMQGMSGAGGIFSGLFGDAQAPWNAANKELDKYLPQAQYFQSPFFNMGKNAIPQFQDWLSGMKDPSEFINKTMGQYQESPWAKFQQNQSIRSWQNLGSAQGLTGSTPLTQFAQQNARDISSQDMDKWLGKVLGVNTQYGQGLNNMIGGGQNAANSLTNLMQDFMNNKASLAYGGEDANQTQMGDLFQGFMKLLPLLGMM